MKKNRKKYSISQKASAVFMILALVWLTISTPFVCSFKQEMAKLAKMENNHSLISSIEDDNSNPLGNNTEEKTPSSGISFSEEYLHDHPLTHYFFAELATFYKSKNSDTYIAYHGELLVPPPNLA
ncbi:MAG TPA: hypothetical protein VLR49_08030 [Ferruginibacter sp.]|nr:hypothetical protein [Ferruginibacter sp.]